ncbi:MAG: hypothetical protein JKY56_01590 [Kofleriaceae bacterium]|nr:hypothetical protein [Kofleriaceae bacterium]
MQSIRPPLVVLLAASFALLSLSAPTSANAKRKRGKRKVRQTQSICFRTNGSPKTDGISETDVTMARLDRPGLFGQGKAIYEVNLVNPPSRSARLNGKITSIMNEESFPILKLEFGRRTISLGANDKWSARSRIPVRSKFEAEIRLPRDGKGGFLNSVPAKLHLLICYQETPR